MGGVPLPGTGAWTGAMVAYLLDMDLREAVTSVLAGVCVAACIWPPSRSLDGTVAPSRCASASWPWRAATCLPTGKTAAALGVLRDSCQGSPEELTRVQACWCTRERTALAMFPGGQVDACAIIRTRMT